MLKNYFEIDENETVRSFLKELSEKKNSQYIILEGEPKYFVDVRSIALKIKNSDEKLKNLKKPLSKVEGNEILDYVKHIIESGDRVIEINSGYFDFINALEYIIKQDYNFLNLPISDLKIKEIFALNSKDKISHARNLFLKNRINILPVIDDTKIVGEIRPIDLLVNELFSDKIGKANFYDSKKDQSLWDLPIENISNKKPHTIEHTLTIKDVITKMISKKLPSVIISSNDEIYGVISYKDIFKLVKKDQEIDTYNIEYNGVGDLYEDEFDLIQDMADKAMIKITKLSQYNHLKISFKTHGNTQGTHKKKFEIKALISHGNKVLNVEKEISRGTSDEEYNDRVNINWNTPQMVQEVLSILERKVKEEKRKNR